MRIIPPEWQYCELGDCSKVNPKTAKPSDDCLVNFFKMADISVEGFVLGGSIKRLSEVATGFTPFAEKDVLVAKITPCFENGKGALINKLVNIIGYGSTEFHVLRATQDVLPEYLLLLTQTHHFRATGVANMTGSAGQKRVPAEFIKYYPVYLPPLHEQKKIVAVINSWNHQVELIKQLIIAKQERRTWFVQQLLSRKLRAKAFSKKWSVHTLGELVEPMSRPVPKPTEPYKALGIRSHCKGTFERFVSDPSKVGMEVLFVARRGDLIVNITFAWEGAIAFVPELHDGHLVSHRFPTYCMKENVVDPDFLRYVVIQPRFIFTLGLISPGGAGRNRVMSKRDLLNIEVSVPCLDEQRKIGKLLKLVDSEIMLLYKKREAMREQKKGLMQQLLTGKVRVKPETEN
jgi:type I restriction enzyme S subunit